MASPNANRAPISPLLCPLAVDEAGNPLAVPPEASYWRVRRDTGGRPRIVNGADLKPLKLPLEFPPEEALNLLGRGSFRFDLCDEAGQQLETVTLKLGQPEPELRNRAGVEDAEPATPATMLPAIGSDVRLVLEANVRATQLAFQHNERTLAASLRLAETLREGVHVLAESQADWIKSLATSRSFFRNAPRMMALPPGVSDADDDEEPDEADEDTDVEQEQPPSLVELLKPGVVRLADRLADGATGLGNGEGVWGRSGSARAEHRTRGRWRAYGGRAQRCRACEPRLRGARTLRLELLVPERRGEASGEASGVIGRRSP